MWTYNVITYVTRVNNTPRYLRIIYQVILWYTLYGSSTKAFDFLRGRCILWNIIIQKQILPDASKAPGLIVHNELVGAWRFQRFVNPPIVDADTYSIIVSTRQNKNEALIARDPLPRLKRNEMKQANHMKNKRENSKMSREKTKREKKRKIRKNI